jgi:hypothetical protein
VHRLFFIYLLSLCCLLVSSFLAIRGGLASQASAAGTETSLLWGLAGEPWEPSGRLPDYSYSGYHRGERPLPERRPDVNVRDFGAVGDGKTDDTAAIKRAVQEAQGKVIAIPPGRYVISDIIEIRHSGTVLQGAGPQLTVFYMPKPLEKIRSNMGATTGGRPTSNYSWSGGIIWAQGRWYDKKLSKVTAMARRGEAALLVDRPDRFKVGDEIRLVLRDDSKHSLTRHHDVSWIDWQRCLRRSW